MVKGGKKIRREDKVSQLKVFLYTKKNKLTTKLKLQQKKLCMTWFFLSSQGIFVCFFTIFIFFKFMSNFWALHLSEL